MSKLHIHDIGGDLVKQDDRYTVIDNTDLDSMIIGSTKLNPDKITSGHKHDNEEIYFIVSGSAEMVLDDEVFLVEAGDVVLVESNVFHQVRASAVGCYFVCVFPGERHAS